MAMIRPPSRIMGTADRKSTRLNSSHGYISYAVFCLKKKKYRFHQRSPGGTCPSPPAPPHLGLLVRHLWVVLSWLLGRRVQSNSYAVFLCVTALMLV